MSTLNDMLPDIITSVTKEYTDLGHNVKFVIEDDNTYPKYFLYVNDKKTDEQVPFDLPVDIYLGAHGWLAGMPAKEIYEALDELIHTLIENEINRI